MKNLLVLFILMLALSVQAQLQNNKPYEFKYAAAIQGDYVNHSQSEFKFTLINQELYWQEKDYPPMNLGVAYYLGSYDGEDGFVCRYQCKEVDIEFARDENGIAISIIYDDKRITFHNYQPKRLVDVVRL